MMKGFAIQQTPHMDENKPNLTCASFEVSGSSTINTNDSGGTYPTDFDFSSLNQPQPHTLKKKRNQPCQPDPEAEVVAYSPRTLFSTNRFVCEICNKGFQRDQNLQLHRRGHNLPWKLQKRTEKEAIRKKVYVCPEISCPHHDPSKALGDLMGLKKHFFRKHGEKKWTCDKCSKRYAVQSDWKAHAKICGTREYNSCECGKLFSRKDSFIFHKGLCGASAERQTPITLSNSLPLKPHASTSLTTSHHMLNFQHQTEFHFNPFRFPINGEQQNFSTLSPEVPPWIANTPHIGPATPMHQNTQSPSLFQEYFHQNFAPNHHNHDDHNLNPNPTTIPFYYPSPPPTASATGVFIEHRQTHLSPHEEFSQSLGSYGVKVDAVTGVSTESGAAVGDVTGEILSSTFFHDDHMTIMNNNHHSLSNSSARFHSTFFLDDHMTIMNNSHHTLSNSSVGFEENVLLGGIMNHQSSEGSETLHATPGQEGGDDDEMTSDFSGLKSLFQNDYLHEYNWFKGLFEQKC